MARIEVAILDPTASSKTLVEVPGDVAVEHLAAALANRMGLPTVSRGGHPERYSLSRSVHGIDARLEGQETLDSVGVKSGDTLRLYAEVAGGCFIPGTQVSLADGTHLPIEHIRPGARVLSFDTTKRELCTGVVAKRTTSAAPGYLLIDGLIGATSTHLFYADGRWLPAGELSTGAALWSADGTSRRIVQIEPRPGRKIVHNLHLANTEHTFFAEGVLVHNEFAKMTYGAGQDRNAEAAGSAYPAGEDRRQLIADIADALEARILVRVRSQQLMTPQEREASSGTLLVRPVFGLPSDDAQYHCDVFIVMPLSQQFQSIYEDYIKPTVESFGLSIRRGDDFLTHRYIVDDIWNAIVGCRLVIADCTGRNANVFYELGICHTIGKPSILLTQEVADLPFDVQGRRAIVYEDKSRGLKTLQDRLKEALAALVAQPHQEA